MTRRLTGGKIKRLRQGGNNCRQTNPLRFAFAPFFRFVGQNRRLQKLDHTLCIGRSERQGYYFSAKAIRLNTNEGQIFHSCETKGTGRRSYLSPKRDFFTFPEIFASR
jgi:hypothetical protein